MGNKFFTTNESVSKLLRETLKNESIILELSSGVCFAKAQRLIKSYAIRNDLQIINEGFRAINSKDEVIKFLKITKIK